MFDAYEVAIRLRLVDQFSAIMGSVISRLVEAHGHADQLQKKLDGIGVLFKSGVLATGVGVGMAMSLKASTNEAVKYEQQLNRLKAPNLGDKATGDLVAVADRVAGNVKGLSRTEALHLTTEAQSITAQSGHTAEIVPELARMRFAIESYMNGGGKGEGHGEKAEGMFRDVVKAAEMRGLMRNFSMEKFQGLMDLFTKIYISSGGQVAPGQMLQMMKTGGVAAKSVNSDFMLALGHLMQESGGSRSGTALMSLYQNLTAGRTTQQVAEQLLKLGLIKPGSIEYGTTGHVKKIKPDALKDAELMVANPLDYLNKVILPAMAKKGVDINDQAAVLKNINQLTSNRTASSFLSQLYLDREQLDRFVAMSKNVKGYGSLYDQSGKSTIGSQADLKAKVANLELEFGNAALPVLKSALEQVIPLVKQFGEWLQKNPDGLSKLVKGLAALSVAMMVSGPIMVAVSGLKTLSLVLTAVSGPLGAVSLAMGFRSIGGAAGLATLAGNLGTVAGQLKLLGAAGAVFLAWELGQKAGDYIQSHMSTETKDKIGHAVANMLIMFGNKDALNAVRINEGTVKPGHGNAAGAKHGDVYLDGHKVGKVLTPWMAKEAGRPQAGAGRFDGNMSQVPVSTTGR